VYAVTIDAGMINPASQDYILGAIRLAEEASADALLIRIDTPGGMLQSTRTIVKAMMASKVPIITYVAPSGAQAGSAGVFITMAGHVAAMAPGTNIGAAHPVSGQGQDIEESGGKDLATKVENDTRAFAEVIARERGRNAEWAARAVTESVSVGYQEAHRLNVVDLIAADDAELLEKAHGRKVSVGKETVTLRVAGARIVEVEMTLKQKFVNTLADPNIAYLLMTIGFLGLYFELSNPGMIFPGVLGGLCLVLAFVALQVIPFNAAGLALMALALVLFILEAFVTSFGLLTIGGVLAMVMGGLLLFDTPDAIIQIDMTLLITVSVLLGAAALALSYLIARSQRQKGQTGAEEMVGLQGHVTQALSPTGFVWVHGEIWSATADEPIAKGEEIEVIALEGLRLRVRRRGAQSSTTSKQGGESA
jgi:membrane-bound serine protease (ClpP class)